MQLLAKLKKIRRRLFKFCPATPRSPTPHSVNGALLRIALTISSYRINHVPSPISSTLAIRSLQVPCKCAEFHTDTFDQVVDGAQVATTAQSATTAQWT